VCELTRKHLQQIIKGEASAPESATVPVPAPTPTVDAGIREPIPNQATVGSAASLNRNTDMQSRLSAEDKESERKENLAREERKKRILEQAKRRVQGFATFDHQSLSLSANSASQEVSRNPTKLATAKAAPVSTPRAPGPVLDLSKKPWKKIVPEYVKVAGNEFFFYQTVPQQDVTRDRNSSDPKGHCLPPPRDSPVLNLSKKSRQKIVLEYVKVTGNEFFFHQPVSQQDMTRGRNLKRF
jgi:hypothetical protein